MIFKEVWLVRVCCKSPFCSGARMPTSANCPKNPSDVRADVGIRAPILPLLQQALVRILVHGDSQRRASRAGPGAFLEGDLEAQTPNSWAQILADKLFVARSGEHIGSVPRAPTRGSQISNFSELWFGAGWRARQVGA